MTTTPWLHVTVGTACLVTDRDDSFIACRRALSAIGVNASERRRFRVVFTTRNVRNSRTVVLREYAGELFHDGHMLCWNARVMLRKLLNIRLSPFGESTDHTLHVRIQYA